MKNNILALMTGVAGAVIGYFSFFWILKYGFYAMVLPGGLVGIGASIFKPKSVAVCVACGIIALSAGLLTEWKFAHFVKDPSFVFLLTHLHHKSPVTLFMIGLGAVLGFMLPWNHRHDPA